MHLASMISTTLMRFCYPGTMLATASVLFLALGKSGTDAFVLVTTPALSPSAVVAMSTRAIVVSSQCGCGTRRNRRSSSLHAVWEGAATALDSFYQTQPYIAAFVTCSIKAGAADYLAQTKQVVVVQEPTQPELQTISKATPVVASSNSDVANIWSMQQILQQSRLGPAIDSTSNYFTPSSGNSGNEAVDVSRSLAFICYGGIYQGLWQQFLYTNLFPSWVSVLPANLPTVAEVAFQVAIEMALLGPFLCLPTAYAVKSLFAATTTTTKTVSSSSPLSVNTRVRNGLDKYVQDCTERGLLLKYWAMWIPVNGLVFSVVPMHLRVVLVATVSFVWIIVLSDTAADGDTN